METKRQTRKEIKKDGEKTLEQHQVNIYINKTKYNGGRRKGQDDEKKEEDG